MSKKTQSPVPNIDANHHSHEAIDPKSLADACLAVLESDPGNLRALRELGGLMRKQGKLPQSISLLDRAALLAPEDSSTFVALGEALLDKRSLDAALAVFRRAATLAPDDATAWRHIGRVLHRMARYEEAIAVTEHALKKTPQDANLVLLSGQILISLQRLDSAMQRLQAAAKAMPEDPWPHLGIALVHLLRGELPKGFAAYRWRKKIPGFQQPKFAQPAWFGGDAVGKTILVYAEQGLGDVLHFARYLPLLVAKGAHVLLACEATLHPVLRGMDGVTLMQPNVRAQFDCHVSLLDLPDLFGTRLENIPVALPYLHAPKDRLLPASLPGCRLRIGIVWAGNTMHNNARNRDCTAEHFLSLAGHRGVELFSLQVGAAGAALAACGGDVLITPLGPQLHDMGVTAAILAELDLLITVDTAAAHLAGALGRPTWLLLSYAPDWRWILGRDDTPWYPGMRLFRQSQPDDWDSVFEVMGQALDKLLQEKQGQNIN